jgi:hypothetical protein
MMYRIARTREEAERLEVVSGMFQELYHHLKQCTSMFCDGGDLTEQPTQEAATLELLEAAWLLFDGHTPDSSKLRETLDAFGKRFGFNIQRHVPIDVEDVEFLKSIGIAPADEGRL